MDKERKLASKIIYGWAYTSKRAENIDNRSFSCPHCNSTEDTPHLWNCRAEVPKQLRISSLLNIKMKLSSSPPHFPLIAILDFLLGAEGVQTRQSSCLQEHLSTTTPFKLVSGFIPRGTQLSADAINIERARTPDRGSGIHLIRISLWKLLIKLWKCCNDQKYVIGEVGRTNARREMLLSKAANLRKLIPYCVDCESRRKTFDELHNKRAPDIEAWIVATEARGRRKYAEAMRSERVSRAAVEE